MKSIFSARFAFCVFKINLISFSVCLSPLSFPSQSFPLCLYLCLSAFCSWFIIIIAVFLLLFELFRLFELLLCCSLIRLAVSSLSRCVYWVPPVASILRFEMFNQYAAKYIRIPESVKLWQTDRRAGRRAGNHLQLTYREHDLGWFSALASLSGLFSLSQCAAVQELFLYMRRKRGI